MHGNMADDSNGGDGASSSNPTIKKSNTLVNLLAEFDDVLGSAILYSEKQRKTKAKGDKAAEVNEEGEGTKKNKSHKSRTLKGAKKILDDTPGPIVLTPEECSFYPTGITETVDVSIIITWHVNVCVALCGGRRGN